MAPTPRRKKDRKSRVQKQEEKKKRESAAKQLSLGMPDDEDKESSMRHDNENDGNDKNVISPGDDEKVDVDATPDEEKGFTSNPRNKRDARETKSLKREQRKETLHSLNLGFGLKILVKSRAARKEAMQRRDTEKMAVREETAECFLSLLPLQALCFPRVPLIAG